MKRRIILSMIISTLFLIGIGCGNIKDETNTTNNKISGNNYSGIRRNIEEADMRDNGQTILVDDYSITLKKEFYDGTNFEGYCIFEVKKKEGKEKVNYTDNHGIGLNNCSFGDDNRYVLQVGQLVRGGATESDIVYKENGNNLFLYYNFSLHTREFDGKIYIMDTKSNPELEYEKSENIFTLTNSAQMREYISDDNCVHLTLSNMALQIASINEMYADNPTIRIIYSDGSSEEIITKGDFDIEEIDSKGYATYDGDSKVYVKYRFVSLKDVDKIDSINYNGKTCVLKE